MPQQSRELRAIASNCLRPFLIFDPWQQKQFYGWIPPPQILTDMLVMTILLEIKALI